MLLMILSFSGFVFVTMYSVGKSILAYNAAMLRIETLEAEVKALKEWKDVTDETPK